MDLSENPAAMGEVPGPRGTGCRALPGGCRYPAVHPAAGVDSHDRAAVVAGEEAAHSLHAEIGRAHV